MGKIAELAKDYEKFIEKKYIYYLENGTSFNVIFEKKRFAHLLGLHKIVDIPQFYKLAQKKYSGSKAFKDVRNEDITDQQIFESYYFDEIEDRYIYFSKIEDIVFQKVVYNFNKEKAKSKIKADMMMYTIEDGLYLHLFLVKSKNGDMVPMTFLVDKSNQYIDGQTDILIKELHIKEKEKEDLTYTYIFDKTKNVKQKIAIDKVINDDKFIY